ncbi:MAG: NADH:flavin oxidoreductase [Myxococcales bacterium]|nr:NADH:flavin oxidoreductase [Myxococcales bacterium]
MSDARADADARRLGRVLPVERWPDADEASRMRWFSPRALGPRQAEQRTWIPAMVPWRASLEGEVTPAVLSWYRRFALGRPGVLVVEATGVRDVPSGPLLRIGHDRYLPGLRRLCREVREASGGRTLLLIQLIDFLALKRRPTRERFFLRFLIVDRALRLRAATALEEPECLELPEDDFRQRLLALDPSQEEALLSPRQLEDLRRGYRERVTDTQLPEVRDLPRTLPGRFAEAADRARRAGFDGVELHYAHAYTMASFLSRLNTRTDGYGDSDAGRLRLPLEVLAAVRARVGDELVVGARLLGDEAISGGSRIEDAERASLALARAGLDFVSVSKGGKFEDARAPKVGEAIYPYTGPSGHECMPTVRIEGGCFGRNVPLASRIRLALRDAGLDTPVVTAGGIASPWQAEAILDRGEADFVAAARQSLADPDWLLKTRRGHGEQVRRCFFTNYCEALDQHQREVTCQRWDRLDLDELPAEERSRDGARRLTAP